MRGLLTNGGDGRMKTPLFLIFVIIGALYAVAKVYFEYKLPMPNQCKTCVFGDKITEYKK
jgi:hypothetical protein